jgi:hypothetical protein
VAGGADAVLGQLDGASGPGQTMCSSVLASVSAAQRINLTASAFCPSACAIQASASARQMSTWSAQ